MSSRVSGKRINDCKIIGNLKYDISLDIDTSDDENDIPPSHDFTNLKVGDEYTVDFQLKTASRELHLRFHSVRDPTGGYRSSQRHAAVKFQSYGGYGGTTLRESEDTEYYMSDVVDKDILGFMPDNANTINKLSIDIQIKDKQSKDAAVDPVQQYIAQQIKLFEDSKKYGDLTLMIHEKQKESESESIETPPKAKRRKTNDGNEEGQSSSSTTGITSESNKNSKSPIVTKTYGAILRSASKVFESALNNNMKEKEKDIMEIHAEDAKDVDDMLYYIMVNDLRKEVNPRTLIKLAHLYELKGLFAACSTRIVADL